MADCIDAVLDHVAIAVEDPRSAEARWRDDLGAGRSSIGTNPTFGSRQLRFANGGKLELLSPAEDAPADNFVRRFIQRFGSAVHHLTLKVPHLHQAVDTLQAAGLDVVDVNDAAQHWQEGFLRPSQVGGLVVQIASTPLTDADWAAFTGFTPEQPQHGAPDLHGPLLRHPDLDLARSIWTTLGARITQEPSGRIRCGWPASPLDVVIEAGEPAGPVALRMSGAGELPPAPGVGPAVIDEY